MMQLNQRKIKNKVKIYGEDETVNPNEVVPYEPVSVIVDANGNPIPFEESKDSSQIEQKLDEIESNFEKIGEESKSEKEKLKEKIIEKYIIIKNNEKKYKENKSKYENTKGFKIENAEEILKKAMSEKDRRKAREDLHIGAEESKESWKKAEYGWALNEFEHEELTEKAKNDYVEVIDKSLSDGVISSEEAENLKNVDFTSEENENKIGEILNKQDEIDQKPALPISDSVVQQIEVPTRKNAKILELVEGDIRIDGKVNITNMREFNSKILRELEKGKYSGSKFSELQNYVFKEGDAAVQRMNNFINDQNVENAMALKTKSEKRFAAYIVESQQAGMIIAASNMEVKSNTSSSSRVKSSVRQVATENIREGTNGTQGVIESINNRKASN